MSMRSTSFTVVLFLLGTVAATGATRAAESYDNCTGFIDSLPATITEQGVWCLDKDVSTALASGIAVHIAANNVTLDCNGFKIGGLAAGTSTMTYGVYVDANANAVVRGCNIRGFRRGVYATVNGSGHLFEDNRFDGNTIVAIRTEAVGTTVRRNLVFDTGNSSAGTSNSFGIYVQNGADVIDNTINGVFPPAGGGTIFGISATSNWNGTISGNRIRDLAPASEQSAFYIYYSTGNGVVDGNRIMSGTVFGTTYGVYCTGLNVSSVGNVFIGIEVPLTNCVSSGDVINEN